MFNILDYIFAIIIGVLALIEAFVLLKGTLDLKKTKPAKKTH